MKIKINVITMRDFEKSPINDLIFNVNLINNEGSVEIGNFSVNSLGCTCVFVELGSNNSINQYRAKIVKEILKKVIGKNIDCVDTDIKNWENANKFINNYKSKLNIYNYIKEDEFLNNFERTLHYDMECERKEYGNFSM